MTGLSTCETNRELQLEAFPGECVRSELGSSYIPGCMGCEGAWPERTRITHASIQDYSIWNWTLLPFIYWLFCIEEGCTFGAVHVWRSEDNLQASFSSQVLGLHSGHQVWWGGPFFAEPLQTGCNLKSTVHLLNSFKVVLLASASTDLGPSPPIYSLFTSNLSLPQGHT